MRVGVIIPSRHGDSPVLRDAISALAKQTITPAQVIISIDDEQAPAPDCTALDASGVEPIIVRGPNAGPAATRNRALPHVESDFILFLNDDVVPDPECIAQHVSAHVRTDQPCMILGAASWVFENQLRQIIDRLVSETSLVFFYDQMGGAEPERDWRFRHAWTLNVSLPTNLVTPFDERLCYPMFDDLEWAFRVTSENDVPVRYLPGALVHHHHRPAYTALSLLRREVLLGHQAHALRAIAPACYTATFGAANCPGFARLDEQALADAVSSFAAFASFADQPGNDMEINEIYEQCRLWRDAARSLGWHAAENNQSFEQAVDAALDLFASVGMR